MIDERARYFRRLRRLRGSARRWTVLAGGFAGAAAVLLPYQGLGAVDAVWAGLAGAAGALAWWRWSDARALAALPAPDPLDPAIAGDRLLSVVAQLPGGRSLAEYLRRQRTRGALRGSAAAPAAERLDRAAQALAGLAARLGGPASDAVREAAGAERGLRQLTDRILELERALRLAPADARSPLDQLRSSHLTRLEQGVAAYEQLVVAAAGYLAEIDRAGSTDPSVARLTDAADLLRGVTSGLAELRNLGGELPA